MEKKLLTVETKKKMILSIAFGLIGFVINLFPIHIYSFEGINVTVLLGLIFPLFITIIWGWKYGLISALAGGCQAMWFLWYGDGYGLLYAVPIYTLWIVWHGVLSDFRRKHENKKWYQSAYLGELIFRVFSELGFITIFRRLVSQNPPFWDTSVTVSVVPNEWLTLIIAKHILFSLSLLLIVKLVIHNKTVRKLFNIQNAVVRGDNIIIASILIAFLAIILQAVGTTYVSPQNEMSFLDNLFNFDDNQIYTKSIILFMSLLGGFIISIFYNRIIIQRNKIKEILKLTERIGTEESKKISRKDFLSDLLTTSLTIIDEADYGVAVIYEDDVAVFTEVSGHDKQLIGFKMKGFIDSKKAPKIIKINNGKQLLLSKAEGKQKRILNAYMKTSNESLIMILSYNEEKIAGIVLEKEKGEFSQESMEMVKTLKNIPVTFFSQVYSYQEKQTLFESIIYSIVKILSLHNEYTKKHSINVAKLAAGIAAELGFNENQVDIVYWTGLVHDIGKILIPDNILNKQSTLTNEEWEMIKKHPAWGYETLDDNESLKEIAEYILYHHERWDGKGYPKGISGEDIPLVSRIIAVADTYDAMTNKRPYRKALSKETAINEITKNIGTQFDPNVAKTFINNIDKIIEGG